MKLSQEITDVLLDSENRALATTGKHGINVVPVSTMYIVDDKIWLINYFLKKTLDNILDEPQVALVCWKGFSGYQIKGHVEYLTTGELFEEAKEMVFQKLPDRIVKGLIVLTPENIYDISPKA